MTCLGQLRGGACLKFLFPHAAKARVGEIGARRGVPGTCGGEKGSAACVLGVLGGKGGEAIVTTRDGGGWRRGWHGAKRHAMKRHAMKRHGVKRLS